MSFWRRTRNKISSSSTSKEVSRVKLSEDIEKNIMQFLDELGHSADVVVRRFIIGNDAGVEAALIYIDGLVNSDHLNNLLEILLTENKETKNTGITISGIKEHLLNIGSVEQSDNISEILSKILNGSTALIINNEKSAIIADIKGSKERGLSEPENQLVLRGPKVGFTENIRTNTALIRRIISSSKLRLENISIGTLTNTSIGIMYIEGIANSKVVEEVRRRIKSIETDSIVGIGPLEDYIQDNYRTLFPQIMYTERPDTASGNLLEGKIVIIVDGTPFVMIVPVTFFMFFQSADDYYLKWQISSFLRMLRFISFFIAISLPAVYVATTTYHPEIIPTTLLISLAAQREGIPFPAFVEALMMELTFEVLREAGVRMPRAIGQAVSIVGALVLGTAAVEAGIVSAAMVIIVSMTGIASFTSPFIDLANSGRLIRFIWLFLGASLGLFGILFGIMLMLIHLSSLRSFGIPYFSGVGPFNLSDQKDLFIRAPRFLMFNRPVLFAQQNSKRQGRNIPTATENRHRPRKDRQ